MSAKALRFTLLLSISAFAVSANAFLTASPSYVNFGNVPVGNFGSNQTVWVQNNSDEPADIQISDTCFGDFDIQKYSCWRRLQAHESCTISGSFQPHSEGYKSCSMNLYASQGGSASISFSGTGYRRNVEGENAR